MKIAVDAGHGMDNTRLGVFDSGAESGSLREADITLAWALTLKQALVEAGIGVFLTRGSNTDSCPLGTRASRAKAAGCTRFVAIHVDSTPGASGYSAYYRNDAGKAWAQVVGDAVGKATGLKCRGIKPEGQTQHSRLAVLGFSSTGPACLVEIGFIEKDAAVITDRDVRIAFARELVASLKKLQAG